jgi:hypothetical protein
MSHWRWALTQFVKFPDGIVRNVAESYGAGGCENPRVPDGLLDVQPDETGLIDMWGLVVVHGLNIDSASTDPRVQPYHTLYDTITPETVAAYKAQGATEGMLLCQLLALLSRWEPTFGHVLHTYFGG